MYELKGIELREYQKNILATAREKNTLVVLPTGLGKTVIALALSLERLNKFKDQKILFLAPTRPLVNQHYNFFLKHSNLDKTFISVLTGKLRGEKRKKIWMDSLVVFATPQTIENDLKEGRINLRDVCLLIVDECHRSVKNYSYTYVAKRYVSESNNPLVLGLTASPGHSEEDIREICRNLDIKRIEMRTEEDEDVKPYVFKKVVNVIQLDLPRELLYILNLLKESFRTRILELKESGLIDKPPSKVTKSYLLEKSKKLLEEVKSNRSLFPQFLKLAEAVKIYHALELLQTQGLSSLKKYFEKLIEEKKRSNKRLFSDENFKEAYLRTLELLSKGIDLPKFEKLKEIILMELQKNPEAKFIVFSSYRKSVNAIIDFLKNVEPIRVAKFVGQAGSDGMKQEEQIQKIREFEEGIYNVLVCTTIGEEGLHIPEVDVAIFFEPIPSALRTIQRRGRVGRTKFGKIYVLVMRKTIDEGYFWVSTRREKKMKKVLGFLRKSKTFEEQRKLTWYL